MDYLFYHSIQQSPLKNFIISYDIACQCSITLKERMFTFDHQFFLFNGVTQVKFFVSKFHLPAPITVCQLNYSFNYGKGVGRTDGEAPERGWSDTNALAPSTREMGPGSRRDTLDYHFGDHNWQKVISTGQTRVDTPTQKRDATHKKIRDTLTRSSTYLMPICGFIFGSLRKVCRLVIGMGNPGVFRGY